MIFHPFLRVVLFVFRHGTKLTFSLLMLSMLGLFLDRLGMSILMLVLAAAMLPVHFLSNRYLDKEVSRVSGIFEKPDEETIEKFRSIATEVNVYEAFYEKERHLTSPDFEALHQALQDACYEVHNCSYEDAVDKLRDAKPTDRERKLSSSIVRIERLCFFLVLFFVTLALLFWVVIGHFDYRLMSFMTLTHVVVLVGGFFIRKHLVAERSAEILIRKQENLLTDLELKAFRQDVIKSRGNVSVFDKRINQSEKPLKLKHAMIAHRTAMGADT